MSAAPLLLVLLTTSSAPLTSIPPPSGNEAALITDIASESGLKKFSLLDAALIASGVPDAQLDEKRAKVKALLEPVIQRARRKKTAAARGKALLMGLHEQVFRRYVASQSDVLAVAQTGEFNCVSSAVLFLVAAEGLLENPRAVLTPAHAFARVSVDGRTVDVETTIDQGFDPDPRYVASTSFLERVGISLGLDGKKVDANKDRAKAIELPPVALVATVYSNRAVDLVEKGDVAGAALALDRATRVAPGELHDRLATWRATLLVNAAADLINAERAQDAVPLLTLGLEGTSGSTRDALNHNLAAALQKVARQKAAGGAYNEALALLDEAKGTGAKIAGLEKERAGIVTKLAAKEKSELRCDGMAPEEAAQCHAAVSDARFRNKDLDGALGAARRAILVDSKPVNARIAMWNALNARADAYRSSGDCRSAENYFQEAEQYRDVAAADPSNPLSEKVGGCWGLLSVNLHKAGKDQEALEALQRALVWMPTDKTLTHNLAAMQFNKALGFANAGKCDEARPLVVNARSIDAEIGRDGETLLASCAYTRALVHWNKQEWQPAAAELRRGLRDAPTHGPLKENLGRALYNVAVGRQEQGDCDEAMALLDEAVALGLASDVSALRRSCGKQ